MDSEVEILEKYIKLNYKTKDEFARKIGMTRQNLGKLVRDAAEQNGGKFRRIFHMRLEDAGINIFQNVNSGETKTAPVVDAEYMEIVREQMKNLKNQFSILEELLRRTDK